MSVDLAKRLEIRKDQMTAPEALMTKIRADIQAGWLPRTSKELGDLLKLVHTYGKKVGMYEECKDIKDKMGSSEPKEAGVTMEKLGVQCNGNHLPDGGNLDKKASGDLQCRYCGAKFAAVHTADSFAMKDQVKKAGTDAKGAVEKMLGIE